MTTTTIFSGGTTMPHNENGKRIGNLKESTIHLNAAKEYYLEAEKYKEAGEIEKASLSSFKSKAELRFASQAIKDESRVYENYF